MGPAAIALMAVGATQSAIGAFYSAKTQQYQAKSAAADYEFQASMSDMNARLLEQQATSIYQSGAREIGQTGMRYAQARGATEASQSARGIRGASAAETLASQDYVRDLDMMTLNVNRVRAAGQARLARVAAKNEANFARQNASVLRRYAKTIDPIAAVQQSLLSSANSAAGSGAF
jgi:phage terminase small subunit